MDILIPFDSETTRTRRCASEPENARLDTVDLLYKAANGGNVSAMETLLEMTDRWRPDLEDDAEDDDAWEDVVPNLSRNPEIRNNGKNRDTL